MSLAPIVLGLTWAAVVLGAAGATALTAADVERALRGDRTALRGLVERLFPLVAARVRAFVRRRPTGRIGPHDAHDLAQDLWVTLFKDDGRSLREWSPERGLSLEGYVGLLAQRELWARVREESAGKRGGGLATVELDPERSEGGPAGDPERLAADRDLLTRLASHLEASLPERGRLVLRLLYTDECSPSEAAAVLGVEVQVVYNWQFRIRKLAQDYCRAATAEPEARSPVRS